MKMSPREAFALRDYLGAELRGRTISDARQVVSLTDILGETCLAGRLGELSGRSVLLAVADQLISGIVMTELDGVARRMLLCPLDLNADYLQAVAGRCRHPLARYHCGRKAGPARRKRLILVS